MKFKLSIALFPLIPCFLQPETSGSRLYFLREPFRQILRRTKIRRCRQVQFIECLQCHLMETPMVQFVTTTAGVPRKNNI